MVWGRVTGLFLLGFKLAKIKSNVRFLDYDTFKKRYYRWFRLDG